MKIKRCAGAAAAAVAHLAGLVARAAVPLRLLEVVDVDVSALGRVRDDLVPLDRLDVAQVVVVQDAHAAFQYIWKVMVK